MIIIPKLFQVIMDIFWNYLRLYIRICDSIVIFTFIPKFFPPKLHTNHVFIHKFISFPYDTRYPRSGHCYLRKINFYEPQRVWQQLTQKYRLSFRVAKKNPTRQEDSRCLVLVLCMRIETVTNGVDDSSNRLVNQNVSPECLRAWN